MEKLGKESEEEQSGRRKHCLGSQGWEEFLKESVQVSIEERTRRVSPELKWLSHW